MESTGGGLCALPSNKATTRGFHPTADDALARWLDVRGKLSWRRSLSPVPTDGR